MLLTLLLLPVALPLVLALPLAITPLYFFAAAGLPL